MGQDFDVEVRAIRHLLVHLSSWLFQHEKRSSQGASNIKYLFTSECKKHQNSLVVVTIVPLLGNARIDSLAGLLQTSKRFTYSSAKTI
jgi:hypothetical protein